MSFFIKEVISNCMALNKALLGLLKGVIFNYDEMVQKYDISYITVKRHIKRLRRENA